MRRTKYKEVRRKHQLKETQIKLQEREKIVIAARKKGNKKLLKYTVTQQLKNFF